MRYLIWSYSPLHFQQQVQVMSRKQVLNPLQKFLALTYYPLATLSLFAESFPLQQHSRMYWLFFLWRFCFHFSTNILMGYKERHIYSYTHSHTFTFTLYSFSQRITWQHRILKGDAAPYVIWCYHMYSCSFVMSHNYQASNTYFFSPTQHYPKKYLYIRPADKCWKVRN